MNGSGNGPSGAHKPLSTSLWAALAVLSCPCHLPVVMAVLAGTTAGAFIRDHWIVAALALTGLFVLSATRVMRAFRRGS
jgi:mercuric ion transport protein